MKEEEQQGREGDEEEEKKVEEEEGDTEEETTPTSIALSVFLWRQWQEGRTGGGVAMGTDRGALCECVCTCMHVGAQYPARRASGPCAWPPEACGISRDAPARWPESERVRE